MHQPSLNILRLHAHWFTGFIIINITDLVYFYTASMLAPRWFDARWFTLFEQRITPFTHSPSQQKWLNKKTQKKQLSIKNSRLTSRAVNLELRSCEAVMRPSWSVSRAANSVSASVLVPNPDDVQPCSNSDRVTLWSPRKHRIKLLKEFSI